MVLRILPDKMKKTKKFKTYFWRDSTQKVYKSYILHLNQKPKSLNKENAFLIFIRHTFPHSWI